MKLNTANIPRRRVLGTALAVAGLATSRPLQDAFQVLSLQRRDRTWVRSTPRPSRSIKTMI